MPRRVKSAKKRKYAGNRSFGGGNAKNRRGKGNRGGVGRAGFHKHNWLRTIKRGEMSKRSRGEHGFSSLARKLYEITVEQISKLALSGKLEQKEGFLVASFPKTKVISNGFAQPKLDVRAKAFSAKAKEKIESAGGKTTVLP
ncbi:MAG: uL15 family ribosomal protein [Candidatus Micrarchaeota archaeon]